MGRLLDLGTAVRQEDDSRDLFEKVFQKLDKDSSKTVSRSEFQEYFRPARATYEAGGNPAGIPEAVHSDPVAERDAQQPHGEVDDEWEEIPGGCCGGGGKRLKPKPTPDTVALPKHQPAFQVLEPAARQPVTPSPIVSEPQVQTTEVLADATPPVAVSQAQHTAPTCSGADISPDELEELQEELVFLRSQLKSRGDALRSKEVRLEEVEKENIQLRNEYNLQSLRQDTLVHMWSMHLLDADLAEDE